MEFSLLELVMSRLISSIIYRRRKYTLLILILLINTFLNFTISGILSDTESRINTYYYDRFGEHHAAYFDLNSNAISKIKNDHSISSGFFYTYSPLTLKDTTQIYTPGCFDNEAMALGHIKLLEGRYPSNNDEISVEKTTLLKRMPAGTGIGDTIFFVDEEGNESSFTIVGIISDFRGTWNNSKQLPVTPGRNSYPSLICCYDSGKTIRTNALIKFGGIPKEGAALMSAADYYFPSDSGCKIDSLSTAYNENMYYWTSQNVFGFFKIFKLITIVIMLVADVTVTFIFTLELCKEYEKSIKQYSFLGASKTYIFFFINSELITVILFPLIIRLICLSIFKNGSILFVISDIIMFLLAINLYIYRHITSKTTMIESVWKYLRNIMSSFTRKKEPKPSSYNKQNIIKRIFVKNKNNMLPSIFTLSVIITAFIISSFYSLHVNDIFEDPEVYDFQIDNLGYGWIFANNIIYTSETDSSIPYDKVLELYDLPGIDHITALYIPSDAILVKKSDDFWNYISVSDLEDTLEGSERIKDLPDKRYSTVLDYSYYIITDNMEEELKTIYPGFPFEEMKRNSSVVLLAPPVDLGDKMLSNSTIHDGDELYFGSLNYIPIKKKYIAFISPEDLEYKESSLKVEKCYNDDSFLSYLPLDNDICIVVHEETLRDLNIAPLCSTLRVWLDANIADEEYRNIEDKLSECMQYSVNSLYYSKKDRMEQQSALIRSVNLSLIINACSYGAYSIISIYILMFMNMLSRFRTIGILRSMGFERKTLQESLFRECFVYMLGIVIISFILIIMIFDRLWALRNILDFRYLPIILLMGAIYLILLTVIPILISAILAKTIYKRNISETIRYNE